MLGNVAPRALRITSQPVVYSGRDNVTALTLEVLSGRRYVPLDLSAVTRWLLVFPGTNPQTLIDSATEAVFTTASGGRLTIDLSGYAIDASIQPCWLIAYDAEHPMGQVLVDNVDCVVSFDFRAVSGTGLVPLPLVEYVTAAPADGKKYLQQNGGWVEATALVSGVASVDGRTGAVTLNDLYAPAAHVGATGTAHGVATDSVAGFMAAADKTKLDGVASGATANSSDATLLARANHTGEQAISTVTGLQAALDKALFAPVVTEAGTARTSLLSDAGSYLRFTNTGAKTYTVEPQANVAWVADSEIHGRNAAASSLTLTAGSGVTLNAPFGGTLLIPTGGSFTLKRGAENVWDVIGQTVAA